MTWAQNWKTCCALGMKPLAFTKVLEKDLEKKYHDIASLAKFSQRKQIGKALQNPDFCQDQFKN